MNPFGLIFVFFLSSSSLCQVSLILKPFFKAHFRNPIFFKADPEPQHAGDNQIEMDKRFSMNFLDTLGPQKRFSMNFHDTVTPHKRFSMNYRDMLGPLNKRFSMNFLDTVGRGRPHKRFSMNYFDTIGHKEHRPRKRFSMNFMDVIGDSRNRYVKSGVRMLRFLGPSGLIGSAILLSHIILTTISLLDFLPGNLDVIPDRIRI